MPVLPSARVGTTVSTRSKSVASFSGPQARVPPRLGLVTVQQPRPPAASHRCADPALAGWPSFEAWVERQRELARNPVQYFCTVELCEAHEGLRCSFCGRTDVGRLVAGGNVFICRPCAAFCIDILDGKPREKYRARRSILANFDFQA